MGLTAACCSRYSADQPPVGPPLPARPPPLEPPLPTPAAAFEAFLAALSCAASVLLRLVASPLPASSSPDEAFSPGKDWALALRLRSRLLFRSSASPSAPLRVQRQPTCSAVG